MRLNLLDSIKILKHIIRKLKSALRSILDFTHSSWLKNKNLWNKNKCALMQVRLTFNHTQWSSSVKTWLTNHYLFSQWKPQLTWLKVLFCPTNSPNSVDRLTLLPLRGRRSVSLVFLFIRWTRKLWLNGFCSILYSDKLWSQSQTPVVKTQMH